MGHLASVEIAFASSIRSLNRALGYEVLTPPVGRNVSETFRQLQAFRHVRNSKGTEATPSGWKPGTLALKPGPDLVGKVWEV